MVLNYFPRKKKSFKIISTIIKFILKENLKKNSFKKTRSKFMHIVTEIFINLPTIQMQSKKIKKQ